MKKKNNNLERLLAWRRAARGFIAAVLAVAIVLTAMAVRFGRGGWGQLGFGLWVVLAAFVTWLILQARALAKRQREFDDAQ